MSERATTDDQAIVRCRWCDMRIERSRVHRTRWKHTDTGMAVCTNPASRHPGTGRINIAEPVSRPALDGDS
jgi:hypothetical protein